jgi:hypothetical protein
MKRKIMILPLTLAVSTNVHKMGAIVNLFSLLPEPSGRHGFAPWPLGFFPSLCSFDRDSLLRRQREENPPRRIISSCYFVRIPNKISFWRG